MERVFLALLGFLVTTASCAADQRDAIDATEHFEFFAVPGVSQHHFLHQWARRLLFGAGSPAPA